MGFLPFGAGVQHRCHGRQRATTKAQRAQDEAADQKVMFACEIRFDARHQRPYLDKNSAQTQDETDTFHHRGGFIVPILEFHTFLTGSSPRF